MRRPGTPASALAAVVSVAVIVLLVVVLVRSRGPGTTTTAPTAPGTTTAPATSPTTPTAPAPPPPPRWGSFAGAPPPFTRPAGGSVQVERAGTTRVVTLRRPNGTTYAQAHVDPRGRYLDARYYGPGGSLRLVVSATLPSPVRVAPAGAAARRRTPVRCGADARSNSGWIWRRFPVRWHADLASAPAGVTRPALLAALRAARVTWIKNLNHCGIPDRSRVTFSYQGTTPRNPAKDGVSVVDFGRVAALGGVCAGTVACTLTWMNGSTAIESDTRFDRARVYSTGSSRRGFDVHGLFVHESGHTLGFGHVRSPDDVMFPYARRGDVSGRRLGRGDANENNAKY
jgi:matrixin